MRLLVLIVGFLTLTACSSLITRGDLKDCRAQCVEKGSCMKRVSKDKGLVNCECKEVAPAVVEEKAQVEEEIKAVEAELEQELNEVVPVEIPALESEIQPAVPEVIPVEAMPAVEEIPVETTPIQVEDITLDKNEMIPQGEEKLVLPELLDHQEH